MNLSKEKLLNKLKRLKNINQKTKDKLLRSYLYDRLEELENGPIFGFLGFGKLGAIAGIKEDIIEFERAHK